MEKTQIGSNALVKIMDIKDVPAKIDTGADSTSVWASDIKLSKDGVLSFKLFAPESPFYTGETISRTDYSVVWLRNAHGGEKIAYRTHLPIRIAGRTIRARVSLTDRSKNKFPILIGKLTIRGKFVVDVSESVVKTPKVYRLESINAELKQDPYAFHQKYFEKEQQ